MCVCWYVGRFRPFPIDMYMALHILALFTNQLDLSLKQSSPFLISPHLHVTPLVPVTVVHGTAAQRPTAYGSP